MLIDPRDVKAARRPSQGSIADLANRALPFFLKSHDLLIKPEHLVQKPKEVKSPDNTPEALPAPSEESMFKTVENPVNPFAHRNPKPRKDIAKLDAEDPLAMMDKNAMLLYMRGNRKLFLKELSNMALDHLSVTSALDILAEQVPNLTNNAARLETSRLKSGLNDIFYLAYLQKIGTMLNVPKKSINTAIREHCRTVWGPKEQSPVVVNANNENRSRRDTRDREKAESNNPKVLSKTHQQVPNLPNPFGIM